MGPAPHPGSPYIKGLRPQTRFGAQPAKPALSAEMSCPEGTEWIKAVPSYENRAPRRIRICAGWDLRWNGFAAIRPHPAACRIDPLRAPPSSPWLPRGAPSGSTRCSPKHSAASGLCRRCGERKPVPGMARAGCLLFLTEEALAVGPVIFSAALILHAQGFAGIDALHGPSL